MLGMYFIKNAFEIVNIFPSPAHNIKEISHIYYTALKIILVSYFSPPGIKTHLMWDIFHFKAKTKRQKQQTCLYYTRL